MEATDLPAALRDYFAAFDGIALERLYAVRGAILELVPGAGEAIKYGIPTVLYKGNLVHYAAFRKHIGFYPTPTGVEAFEARLAPYPQGKGSVQFPYDKPLPLDLIRDIVLFRVAEADKS